jgi:hypothetical protein
LEWTPTTGLEPLGVIVRLSLDESTSRRQLRELVLSTNKAVSFLPLGSVV